MAYYRFRFELLRLWANLLLQGSCILKILELRERIVIQGSSLQGCLSFFFFVRGCWFSFGRTLSEDFSKADKAARWSLQSFCVACVWVWPSAFSEGLLPGESAWWDPATTLSCEIWNTATSPYFASLNAKQRGVGQCWLQCSRAPRWKGPAPHHLTADQAGMLSRVEGSGLCSWANLNKPSFELLNHPSRGARMGGNAVKRGHPR